MGIGAGGGGGAGGADGGGAARRGVVRAGRGPPRVSRPPGEAVGRGGAGGGGGGGVPGAQRVVPDAAGYEVPAPRSLARSPARCLPQPVAAVTYVYISIQYFNFRGSGDATVT